MFDVYCSEAAQRTSANALTAHWNQERVKRKFPTISERDCLSADGRCWWALLVSAGWWMNTRVNPCGWWIWPELLVVPTSPSLPPPVLSPAHALAQQFIKALCGQRKHVFFPAFTILQATATYSPCLIPPFSASLFLFPLHVQSILLRRPAMAQRSKYLANVFKCSVKHPYSG